MKKHIKKASIAFIAVLLALSFFSRTVYNRLLPEVSVVMPFDGALTNTVRAPGKINPADTVTVYQTASAKITEILVKQNDFVAKGQELYRMDTQGIKNSINETKISLEKIDINAQKIHSTIQTRQKSFQKLLSQTEADYAEIENLEGEVSSRQGEIKAFQKKIGNIKDERSAFIKSPEPEEARADFPIELRQLYTQMTEAALDYEDNMVLFEIEAVSSEELVNSKREWIALKSRYIDSGIKFFDGSIDDAQKEIDTQESKTEILVQKIGDLTAGIKMRGESMEQNQADVHFFNIDLEMLELDRRQLEVSLENLTAKLEDCENVISPVDGIVREINITAGEFLPENMKAVVIGKTGDNYSASFTINSNIDFLQTGDGVQLTVRGHETVYADGVISSIENDTDSKICSVFFTAGNILGTEAIEMTKSVKSKPYDMLVPKSVIRKDSDGYFVLAVEKRETLMGYGDFTKKVYVFTGESDDYNIAITRGLDMLYPIVSGSEGAVRDNAQVRIVGE